MTSLKINLIFITAAAEFARIYGICDETAYRNRVIKLEFEQMKIDCPGEIVESLIERLSQKEWNGIYLSYKQIEKICYPSAAEKDKVELAIQLATENNIRARPALSVQHPSKHKRRTYARRK